jgi:hypothetical protein
MRQEIDQTVNGVCDVCSRGWIQRLDDRVSPFLQSMIVGETTTLSPMHRRLLARWAAKTAVVMECASDAPFRTPRFACEFVRRIGVHPGTQVLLGKYDGDRRFLAHERDVFSRTIDGEKCHIPQASFVIGSVFIQVFSDPWRDTAPEPAEQTAAAFIPLVGRDNRTVIWPPDTSIDDERFDLERCGPNDELRDLPAPSEFNEVQRAPIASDVGMSNMSQPPERDASPATGPTFWRALSMRPAAAADPTHNGGLGASSGPAPTTHSISAPHDPTTAARPPFRHRFGRRLAYAAVMTAIAAGLVGFGLHEQSNAARWRASSLSWQARANAHPSPDQTQHQAASATPPTVVRSITTTTTGSTRTTGRTGTTGGVSTTIPADSSRVTPQPAQLTNIINAVPSVTRGLEQCASAALATASDALNFAAAFPNATTNAVDADSTAVSSVCGRARAAANTLTDLVNKRTQ